MINQSKYDILDFFKIILKDDISKIKSILDSNLTITNERLDPSDSSYMRRLFRSVKSSEMMKLFLDYFIENGYENIIYRNRMLYQHKFNIDDNILDNIDKYRKLFDNDKSILQFILCNKSYSNRLLDEIKTYNVVDIYEVYSKQPLKSFYEMYKIIFDKIEFTDEILQSILDKQLNYDNVIDIVKLYSEDDKFRSMMDRDKFNKILEKSIIKIDIDNIDDMNKKSILAIKNIFDRNNIPYDKESFKKSYLENILKNMHNLYKNDKDRLKTILENNKNYIIENKLYGIEYHVEHMIFLYDIDPKLFDHHLDICDDLPLYYSFDDIDKIINDVGSDKFMKIFGDFIEKRFYEFPIIVKNDELRDKIIYSKNYTSEIISFLEFNIETLKQDEIEKILKSFRPLHIDSYSEIYVKYRNIIDTLIDDGYNIKYYIPKDQSDKELERVRYSLKSVLNELKDCNSEKLKFYKLKDLKYYFEILKDRNIEIDSLNISTNVLSL